MQVLGHTVPGKPFVAGLIIAGGVTGYVLWKRHQNGTSGSADASAYGYGQFGYGAFGYGGAGYGLGIASYGYGEFGYGNYGYGGFGYGGFVAPVGQAIPPATPTPSSNAEWTAAVISVLSNEGFDPLTVSEACGKYLLGQQLTQNQGSIIQAAIAAQNYPPVAGASGFPPAMHVAPSTGQGGGGGGTGTKTKKEVGKRHVASGTTSLNQWAKTNKTTAGEVISTTDKNASDGFMTTANHAKFDKYLNKGTGAKMPTGLVFFSTK